MVIDNYVLLLYATVWTAFYWFLSQYIAELSRRKWTRWVQSEESDEVLIEALEAIIDEIENRMHDKLEQFQSSFFGSVGAMTKKAKALDPMNNVRKAAKDGDWMSLMVEYAANKAGLGAMLGQQSPPIDEKGGVTSNETPLKPSKMKDLLHK
jgi:hypothetical protein